MCDLYAFLENHVIVIYLIVGYTVQDVVYRWTEGDGCNVEPDMELSQFDLMKNPPDIGTETQEMNKGRLSLFLQSLIKTKPCKEPSFKLSYI